MATSPVRAQLEFFTKVISNQKQTDAALDHYERIERTEFRKLGSDPKPYEVKVWRVFPAGTGVDKILLSPDAKPISPDSYRAELVKLEKQLVWAAQQGLPQKEAYAKLERKRKERNDLIDSTRQAFLFTQVGEELRGNRKLAKYSMAPNPKFKPASRNATLFTKVRGFLWIDEESSQLARVEGSVTEDISLGLFLAKIYKGSHFMQERYEIAPGVWLPAFQQYDFEGRKFFSSFSFHERTTYSNYRRVGPPSEALQLVRAELSKGGSSPADP